MYKPILFIISSLTIHNFSFAGNITQNTTLNVNAIANKVFPEGPQEYDFHFNGFYDPLIIQKFKTGLKDMEGNDEVYFQLIDINRNDTFYLVPDNHVYPLYFRELRVSNEIETDNTGYRYGADYESRPYLMAESKTASFIWDGYSYGFVRNYDKTVADRKYLVTTLPEEQKEFLKSESAKLWALVESYYQKKIDELNDKKYDDLLSNLDGKIIHLSRSTRYASGSAILIDRPKVVFTKDASGKLTELILWYPFMDGKYYDKPEFKKIITKDESGMFYIKTQDEDLTGFLDGHVIPYSSGFFIMGAPALPDYGGYDVIQCNISAAAISSVWDIEMFNGMTEGFLFFSTEVHNTLGAAFYSDELLAYFQDWWKTKNVTMTYDAKKDMRYFEFWLPAYYAAAAKTAK